MANPLDSQTRVTLLGRLCRSGAADESAWNEFVNQYGRQIYKWCRHWQLQEADAEDVTQTVLVKLAAYMRRFSYDPTRSFRAWLKTVTHNAWQDYVAERQGPGQGSGKSGVLAWLNSVESREDLTQRLEQEFDRELLEKAILRVRLRVLPHTWEAFRLTALERVPAAEAAHRLHMKIAAVYVAKSSVQKMLREEREKLERGEA